MCQLRSRIPWGRVKSCVTSGVQDQGGKSKRVQPRAKLWRVRLIDRVQIDRVQILCRWQLIQKVFISSAFHRPCNTPRRNILICRNHGRAADCITSGQHVYANTPYSSRNTSRRLAQQSIKLSWSNLVRVLVVCIRVRLTGMGKKADDTIP